jgi:hypothetical protein
VRYAGPTHFWNEDKSIASYVPAYDGFAAEVSGSGGGGGGGGGEADMVVGDPSPGYLANTW